MTTITTKHRRLPLSGLLSAGAALVAVLFALAVGAGMNAPLRALLGGLLLILAFWTAIRVGLQRLTAARR